MDRMTDEQLLKNTDAIFKEFWKNIGHCAGIDFERFNLTQIEVSMRLREENIGDPIEMCECDCSAPNVLIVYVSISLYVYAECYNCLKHTSPCLTKRDVAIAWNKLFKRKK